MKTGDKLLYIETQTRVIPVLKSCVLAALVTAHGYAKLALAPGMPRPRWRRTYDVHYLCKGPDESSDSPGQIYTEICLEPKAMGEVACELRLMGLDAYKYPQGKEHSPSFVCLRRGTWVPHPADKSWDEVNTFISQVFDTAFLHTSWEATR